MKRKIAVALVFTLILALCAVFVACDDGVEYDGGYMSCLKDEAKLGEIVMLGAHDAGTVGQVAQACTQHSDFAQMLDGGVRYFDCRVTEVNGELAFVHGNTDGFFLVSSEHYSLSDACDAIAAYVADHPSEVVILDFQHTWTATEDAVIAMLDDKLGDIVLTKDLATNPAQVTMGQMREWGKNVVVVYRTPEKCAGSDFLYERQANLQSDYNSSVHTGVSKTDFENGAAEMLAQLDRYFEAKSGDRLFVLQSQITATGWLAQAESMFRPIANGYLEDLLDLAGADKLAKLNIVMRDFVCDDDIGGTTDAAEAYKLVIRLNDAKGLIDPTMKQTLYDAENID